MLKSTPLISNAKKCVSATASNQISDAPKSARVAPRGSGSVERVRHHTAKTARASAMFAYRKEPASRRDAPSADAASIAAAVSHAIAFIERRECERGT